MTLYSCTSRANLNFLWLFTIFHYQIDKKRSIWEDGEVCFNAALSFFQHAFRFFTYLSFDAFKTKALHVMINDCCDCFKKNWCTHQLYKCCINLMRYLGYVLFIHIGTFDATVQGYPGNSGKLRGLPRGIIHATSDFEARPLWLPSSKRSKVARVYALFFYIIVLLRPTDDGYNFVNCIGSPTVTKYASPEIS